MTSRVNSGRGCLRAAYQSCGRARDEDPRSAQYLIHARKKKRSKLLNEPAPQGCEAVWIQSAAVTKLHRALCVQSEGRALHATELFSARSSPKPVWQGVHTGERLKGRLPGERLVSTTTTAGEGSQFVSIGWHFYQKSAGRWKRFYCTDALLCRNATGDGPRLNAGWRSERGLFCRRSSGIVESKSIYLDLATKK